MKRSATTVEQRFPLRPIPAAAGRCPRCDTSLDVQRLHFAGWRPVIEGVCATCGHRYLEDMPAGHGLRYDTSVDLTTGDIWGKWFGPDLVNGWKHPDDDPVAMDVDIRFEASNPVLLHCLDFIYGHALLRLLNAGRHIDHPDEDLVLLIPAALSPLVPEGVAEVWTVHEPLGRLRGWLPALDERVAAELDRFEHCTLSPAFAHPHPSTFDLERFTGRPAARRAGEPSVVFVLREERFWGGTAEEQQRRVAETWSRLASAFPAAGATVVGVGPTRTWPAGLTDLRVERPDEKREAEWLSVLAGADVAIGVHGSNMLLPSALARSTVELLPSSRFDNYGQATLVTDPDPVATLLRHHTLHGDDDLADVRPERVAELATAVLRSGPSLRTSMLGSFAGQDADRPLEPEFPVGERHLEPAPTKPLAQRMLETAAGTRARVTTRRRQTTTETGAAELARSYLAPGMTSLDLALDTNLNGVHHVDLLTIDLARTGVDALDAASALLDRGAVDALVMELSDVSLTPAGTTSVELVDRLYRWGLRTYGLVEGRLEPFRPVGRIDGPVTLLAANDSGTAKARAAGLLGGDA